MPHGPDLPDGQASDQTSGRDPERPFDDNDAEPEPAGARPVSISLTDFFDAMDRAAFKRSLAHRDG